MMLSRPCFWIATILSFGLTTGLSASAQASDITIHIRSGQPTHHSSTSRFNRVIPSSRTIYPDGRVVERYGYPSGHREVLILPSSVSPVIIQQPVVRPYWVHPLGSQTVTTPAYIPRQTNEPRLLHGRQTQSTPAIVIGIENTSGREGPGAVYTELTQFFAGQTVIVTQVAGGGDGFDWFLASSTEGQQAWIRGDRLSFFEH